MYQKQMIKIYKLAKILILKQIKNDNKLAKKINTFQRANIN